MILLTNMEQDNELLLFDRVNVIKDTINKYGENNFYLSFSGGKDSTILHYLIDMALPNNKIPRVFINTGIEYTAIVEFVKELAEKVDPMEMARCAIQVERALKVLEILKKHIKNSVCLYTDLIGSLIENVEEYDKVKEWLDR